jgi:hypothetical protein
VSRWRCHTCGETFKAWSKAQKHADEAHGGARIELELEQPDLFDAPARPVTDTRPL